MAWQGLALVLHTRVRGEADLSVVLFTRDKGKLRVIARSAMKSKKRFIGQLLLFNHLHVTLASSRRSSNLRLDQSRLIESFPGMRKDIRKVAVASCLCEMADLASPEGEPAPRVYELLLRAFREIDKGKEPDRVRLIFELKLIAQLGFQPSLLSCAHCGAELGDRSLRFSAPAGGLVCQDCAKKIGSAESVSPAAVKSLRRALVIPDDKISRLGFTKSALKESLNLVSRFTTYHLHRPLKSEAFLKKES